MLNKRLVQYFDDFQFNYETHLKNLNAVSKEKTKINDYLLITDKAKKLKQEQISNLIS